MGLREQRPAPKPLLFTLAVFGWLCPSGVCLQLPLAARVSRGSCRGGPSRGAELERGWWCVSLQTAWISPA